MGKSYFEDLGILGWAKIEPIILGAILSNKSVLLSGSQGANKTEGAKLISEAVFGEGTKFVPYDTSLVNADDLLGFLHPKKLAAGEIEYISTPDSIWDATSVLLDEINRCNPYNAAKFFEIVRARTINGRKTQLQFVWAACNPPENFNTAHMDLAQVSRFIVLTVPNFHSLSASEKRQVLELGERGSVGALKTLLDRAATAIVPRAQIKAIKAKTLKIAEVLNKTKDIEFSGRQTRDLFALFMNMDRVAQVFEELEIDEKILCEAVMGLVPETTGLIRGSIQKNQVAGVIATILAGFRLSDPILRAENVVELCKARVKDTGGHAAAISDSLHLEKDPKMIEAAWQEVCSREDIHPDMFNTLRQTFAARAALLKLAPGAKIEDAAIMLTTELQNYSPKPSRTGRKRKG
jgi:hypothetical protein